MWRPSQGSSTGVSSPSPFLLLACDMCPSFIHTHTNIFGSASQLGAALMLRRASILSHPTINIDACDIAILPIPFTLLLLSLIRYLQDPPRGWHMSKAHESQVVLLITAMAAVSTSGHKCPARRLSHISVSLYSFASVFLCMLTCVYFL